LKNVHARSALDTLRELFPEITMVAHEATNNLLVRAGSREQLQQLEAVLKDLDQHEAPKPGPMSAPGDGMGSEGAMVPLTRADLYALEKKLSEAEQRALGLATPKLGEYPPGRKQDLRQRMRREVEVAFEARQQLQRAQLQQLRQRLERIEQSIAAREKLKDKIIDHRVDELLDPNLRWDPTGAPMDPSGANPYDPLGPTGMPMGPSGGDSSDPMFSPFRR
jgi:hypothetical protein